MEKEIKSNMIANRKLDLIRSRVINFVRENIGKIDEKDVSSFMVSEIKKEGMILDRIDPIHFVVIDENTDDKHWSKKIWKFKTINKNCLIMIDYWAKLKGAKNVFADITWMFYVGNKIPEEIEDTFNKVISARNLAVSFIKENLKNRTLPRAKDVDKAVRTYFSKFNLERFFTHRTGHTLGYSSCHGNKLSISRNSRKAIGQDILFTIEPGLYFPGRFGIRSEINCYINKDNKLVITSSVQDKIVKIKI